MTIDNFENEQISDKIQIYLIPFMQLLIICMGFVFLKLLTYRFIHNVFFILLVVAILTIIGLFLYRLYYIFQNHISKVEVDCDNFLFKIAEKEYCFSDLLPEYEVKQNIKEVYCINLYFKSGDSETVFLTKNVALAFMNKYLNKYASPRYNKD